MDKDLLYYQKKLRLSKSLHDFYHLIEFQNKDQFMLELLKMLYNERHENVIARNLKTAGFPVIKTFEEFSFDGIEFPENINQNQLKDLTFIEKQENLIFYGGVGVGKSHCAVSLGYEAIKKGYTVLFFTLHDLINQLVKAKELNKLEKMMNKILKTDLLILDEWGYLPLHQEGSRLLFEVISKCYEKKSIIITTNLEFSHWKSFLFDEKLTVAIIDRVIHYSHLLFFDRESYRKKHALIK